MLRRSVSGSARSADADDQACGSVPEPESGGEVGERRIRLRPMTGSDLADVLAIERASFSTPWSARTFKNLMRRANARLWVAESPRAEVLGYAVAWFARLEAELGDLAVTPEVRRRGIGRALLGAVLDDARSCGIQLVFLEVRESNSAARRLYEAAGFETVGRRPGYYAHPVEDAIVMSIETA